LTREHENNHHYYLERRSGKNRRRHSPRRCRRPQGLEEVALFDLDPQTSAASWSDNRNKPSPAFVSGQPGRLLAC
jgi:hypothetical protein